MPTYKYVAVNLQKQKFKGKYIANDENDLASQLAKQNLYLVSASEYKGGTPSSFFTLGTGKIKLPELTSFCRQFSIMISSGIQVLDCLNIMRNQSFSKYFRSILQVVYDDVKSGEMLSNSLEKHKNVFPEFFISMVRIGEESGNLDMVFVSLAEYYEKDAAIKRKVKAAMIYPGILTILTIGITVLMLAYVVPTFKKVMSTLEVPIEGITAVAYGISDFLIAYWRWILVGVIVLLGGLILFLKTKTGRYLFDKFKVRCVFMRKITTGLISARFARSLSILLSSGMDLASSLDATTAILVNRYVQKKFREASEEVHHGMTITNSFKKYRLFPPMLIQMISVGENSNSLDEVLSRSCGFFDEQVEFSLNSLTSKLQPIILLIMAVIVGTLFIAIYSPMLSIMNTLA